MRKQHFCDKRISNFNISQQNKAKPLQPSQGCKDSSVFLIYLLAFTVWDPIFLLLSDWWLVDKGFLSQALCLLCLSDSLWLSLAPFGFLWLSLALSDAYWLTRPLLGSLPYSCVAAVDKALNSKPPTYEDMTRCQILWLQCVSKILTPRKMLKKSSLIAKINRWNNSFQNMYDMV